MAHWEEERVRAADANSYMPNAHEAKGVYKAFWEISAQTGRISGVVVTSIVAIDRPRVRFAVNASFFFVDSSESRDITWDVRSLRDTC